jgi:sugar lactone lactonase YvrE
LVTDSSGNVFFIDNGGPNNRYIREILASTGNIQTVPGLSSVPDADGLAIDSSGNLYISTAYNNSYYWYLDTNTVQKWTASTGVLTTIAGTTTPGYSGDGGLATSAELNQPSGLVVDSSGDVFVADTYNCVVREISASTGDISTIAGNGTCGTTTYGGLATSTELNRPGGVALDGSGNLYISDSGTHLISEVSASSGDISAVASGSVFSGRLAIDSSGNLYSTNYTNSVLEIDVGRELLLPRRRSSRLIGQRLRRRLRQQPDRRNQFSPVADQLLTGNSQLRDSEHPDGEFADDHSHEHQPVHLDDLL